MKYILVLLFILGDIVTGVIKALYNEGLNSTVLRKGLYHKLAEIITLVGAGFIDYTANYIELGFATHVYKYVAVYICLMEIVSIIENLSEINPSLKALFKPYLEKIKTQQEDKK